MIFLHFDLHLPLSLGCLAAASGFTGGRCAAAKAGSAEVQHGQRSAGERKRESRNDFLLTLENVLPA